MHNLRHGETATGDQHPVLRTQDLGQQLSASLQASWHYNDEATLRFNTDGESFGLQFSWHGSQSSLKSDTQSALDFKHFGLGSVYGTVKAPAKKGESPQPIEGLRILADT